MRYVDADLTTARAAAAELRDLAGLLRREASSAADAVRDAPWTGPARTAAVQDGDALHAALHERAAAAEATAADLDHAVVRAIAEERHRAAAAERAAAAARAAAAREAAEGEAAQQRGRRAPR